MKRYMQASLLLMGFLLVQPTTAMAQCPIKERIMNGEGEADSTSQVRSAPALSSYTLVIFFDKKKGSKPLMKAIKTNACTILYKYKESNGVAIKVREGWDIDKAIAYFKGVKGVLSIGVNGIMQPE